MRMLIIAGALVSVEIAGPALARDGAPYVGVDAGIMKPEPLDLTFSNATMSASDAIRLRHKLGYDFDAVVGYDFGLFRLEGEVGYKHAGIKSATVAQPALAAILLPNQPTHYDSNGRARLFTAMLNGLIDLGPSNGLNGSLGLGIGEARASYRAGLIPSNALNFSSEQRSFAWQALAEIRAPIAPNVDVGLKYRYFQAGRYNFGPFCETTCTTALPYRLRGRYKSNSLLASLTYNFGAAAAPPPPAPPPPPPPPPPPATQTCPNGSEIPATSTCPAPPPPPPPPPPEQRGERGE